MSKKSTRLPEIDSTHRDRSGVLRKKHGNTLIKTLRETYGDQFAAGYRGDLKIKTLLERIERGGSEFSHRKKTREKLSGKSVTLTANASVRFGAALKTLAEK